DTHLPRAPKDLLAGPGDILPTPPHSVCPRHRARFTTQSPRTVLSAAPNDANLAFGEREGEIAADNEMATSDADPACSDIASSNSSTDPNLTPRWLLTSRPLCLHCGFIRWSASTHARYRCSCAATCDVCGTVDAETWERVGYAQVEGSGLVGYYFFREDERRGWEREAVGLREAVGRGWVWGREEWRGRGEWWVKYVMVVLGDGEGE
ncbi:hypothetical protein P152DRAFT_498098, partial [Eremomyces bilateralis CBS 781.70]